MSETAEAKPESKNAQTMGILKYFLDIPITIEIQLAQRSMKVRDILQLKPESVVELPKSAGENLDILMNERLIAYGEVMELEDSTGVRLTDLKANI
jgi:flagellar motor switch protein FliN/FliY